MPKVDIKSDTGIAASQQMIGFLLSFLIEGGIRKCDIDPTDLFPLPDSADNDTETPIQLNMLCSDTMDWMIQEGIARSVGQQTVMSGLTFFVGVSLTSLGIALAQEKNNEFLGGESVESLLKSEEHNSDLYQKLGSFAGLALAGFTKGIA